MRRISGQSFLNMNNACGMSAEMKQALFLCSAALFLGVLAAEPVFGGTVYGKVVDKNYSVTIIFESKPKSKIYKIKTNKNGKYSILLPVGSYTVKIKTNGSECGEIKSYDVPIRQDIKCK